ncbi:MAG: hypothetical protein HFJ37_05895 [Clostridia bacterium]|nr:hypothetical protein [Clostridia bacterium]
MDRMKTFLKYALWVVAFAILSEFLINVGLNSMYKQIERKDEIQQVQIQQAEATLVNGRMKGTIDTTNIDKQYVRIDLFSKRGVFLGKKYIQLQKAQSKQDFSIYFELEDVKSYQVSLVNEKEEGELELIPKEWTKPEIILATAITLLIFW